MSLYSWSTVDYLRLGIIHNAPACSEAVVNTLPHHFYLKKSALPLPKIIPYDNYFSMLESTDLTLKKTSSITKFIKEINVHECKLYGNVNCLDRVFSMCGCCTYVLRVIVLVVFVCVLSPFARSSPAVHLTLRNVCFYYRSHPLLFIYSEVSFYHVFQCNGV